MKNKKRVLLILAAIVVAGLAGVVLLYRSLGSRALESYTRELRAQGEKITFQELVDSLSKETNGWTEVFTNQIRALGPPPVDGTNLPVLYLGPGKALVVSKAPFPPWKAGPSPEAGASWTALNDHSAALRQLCMTLKSVPRNAGPRTNFFQTVTPGGEARIAASWLACAALAELHGGRWMQALTNIQVLSSLCELHREEYSIYSQMVRTFFMANVGLDITWEALQFDSWDDDQLLALQRCWEGHDFFAGLERGFEGERCLSGETLNLAFQRLENGPAVGRSASTSAERSVVQRFYEATILSRDHLFQLQHLQAHVEQARALQKGRPWTEVIKDLQQHDMMLSAKTNSPAKFLYLLTLLCTPNFERAFEMVTLTETKRRLVLTAIALKRFERANGRSAASLDALVPEFLAAVPLDCMTGQPLKYRLKNDGSFLLYSVGLDGTDDGGDPSPTTPGGKPWFGEGRDAVWPSAAK